MFSVHIRPELVASGVLLASLIAWMVIAAARTDERTELATANLVHQPAPITEPHLLQPQHDVHPPNQQNQPAPPAVIATTAPTSTPTTTPTSTTTTTTIPTPDPAPTPTSSTKVSEAVYNPAPSKSAISIPILNYHSVTIQPGNPAAITPQKLEEQMQYLANEGYTTLSLNDFIEIWEGRKKSPAKPVLLTFDDGYADNYTAAMPILKKYNMHATLFVSPGMVNDGYFLNWDQIIEMHQAGWDIQPHGMTHPHLPELSAEKQKFEITEASRQIEQMLGVKTVMYCYPYGERNQTTLNILKEAGIRYAVTIDQGRAIPEQNPLLIRRLFVNGEHGMNQFKALLK